MVWRHFCQGICLIVGIVLHCSTLAFPIPFHPGWLLLLSKCCVIGKDMYIRLAGPKRFPPTIPATSFFRDLFSKSFSFKVCKCLCCFEFADWTICNGNDSLVWFRRRCGRCCRGRRHCRNGSIRIFKVYRKAGALALLFGFYDSLRRFNMLVLRGLWRLWRFLSNCTGRVARLAAGRSTGP